MKKCDIAVIMGSDSDLPIMSEAIKIFKDFKVSYDIQVMSAHRTPALVQELASTARTRGIKVIIAGAGGAAHLAGVVAAHTTLPVIGVPITSVLNGLDSLLATVQMPAGIPVATVAIGKAGATNAALLAIQIMSLSNEKLARSLDSFKKDMVKKVRAKNKRLQTTLKSL
jgi:phosphoribosylaminoimidazole carboxylase PurE protein